MERRDLLKLSAIAPVAIAANCLWQTQPAQAAVSASAPLTPDQALKKLMLGNQRFVQHLLRHPHQSKARLDETAQAQHPFVTVLSCADSRVAGELLFDQGLGDIFDVRVAGNIATPEVLGSIEYAVQMLGTPLLMVLGHERCGAVTAAVQQEALPGSIGSFVDAILPAIAKSKSLDGNAVESAVVANVHYQIEQLSERSQILRDRQAANTLKIIGGRYDLDTGKVTLLT
jgi:carbonic anhydrase